MTTPFYTPAASQDLLDILNYIARDKPSAALAWIDRIESTCLLLAEHPAMGQRPPHLGADVRSTTVGRYVIFHRQLAGRVEILRVIPGDRDIRQL